MISSRSNSTNFICYLETGKYIKLKSLIMAQIERWRHALYMQVERESTFGCEYSGGRVSNA